MCKVYKRFFIILIGAFAIAVVLTVLSSDFLIENEATATIDAETLIQQLSDEMQKPSDLRLEATPKRMDSNGI